jgi:hypothetical protein
MATRRIAITGITHLTLAATEQAILEATEFHLDGFREGGIPIRDPSSTR